MKQTTEQLAWAAGFLDGEGCFAVQETTQRGQVRRQFQSLVDAAQTKTLPLDRLVELFGGRVRPYRRCFYWRLYSTLSTPVLLAIRPYLVGKRAQAELLLEFNAMRGVQGRRRSDAVVARQIEIYDSLRVLNARQPRHAERLSESAPLRAVVDVTAFLKG